jgi:hypothetical protein
VAVFGNVFFETRVEQLFDLARLVETIFAAAGVEYRVIGGLAVYLYVEDVDPDAGRLTRDIDIVIRRQDLVKIAEAAKEFGLEHRHVAGTDMLVQTAGASVRRAVHLVFAGEKVRPDYPEAAPDLSSGHTVQGVRLIPLADLVRMKLTSFRAKDEAHIKDLDQAGLLTAEIEGGLSGVLRQRLRQARARE